MSLFNDKSSHNPYKLPDSPSILKQLLNNKPIVANVINFKKDKSNFKMQFLPVGQNSTFSENLMNKAQKDPKASWLLDYDVTNLANILPLRSLLHQSEPRPIENIAMNKVTTVSSPPSTLLVQFGN